jgi:probable DNA metabolism protein
MRIDLATPIDVLGFRAQANSLLAQQVPPAEIAWQAATSPSFGESVLGSASRPHSQPSALHSIVPRSFTAMTEMVVLHRNPARFDVLYRLLWRLVHEPELAGASGDVDMAHAHAMAQGVRRDIARIRRTLKLRPLAARDGTVLRVGWCEPQHHVTEEVAQWLARTEPEFPWLLASPDRCVHWSGTQLLCGPGIPSMVAYRADDENWHRISRQLTSPSAMVPQ